MDAPHAHEQSSDDRLATPSHVYCTPRAYDALYSPCVPCSLRFDHPRRRECTSTASSWTVPHGRSRRGSWWSLSLRSSSFRCLCCSSVPTPRAIRFVRGRMCIRFVFPSIGLPLHLIWQSAPANTIHLCLLLVCGVSYWGVSSFTFCRQCHCSTRATKYIPICSRISRAAVHQQRKSVAKQIEPSCMRDEPPKWMVQRAWKGFSPSEH